MPHHSFQVLFCGFQAGVMLLDFRSPNFHMGVVSVSFAPKKGERILEVRKRGLPVHEEKAVADFPVDDFPGFVTEPDKSHRSLRCERGPRPGRGARRTPCAGSHSARFVRAACFTCRAPWSALIFLMTVSTSAMVSQR